MQNQEHSPSPDRSASELPAIMLAGVVCAGAIMLTLGAWWGMNKAQQRFTPGAALGSVQTWQPPAGPMLSASDFVTGRELFLSACSACHGPTGLGVPNLGKDLVHGKFPLALSDTGLAKLIIAGRDAADPMNTTKIPMPPRGGRADLTDAQVDQIVVFIRGLQDPRRVPSDLPPAPEPGTLLASGAVAASGASGSSDETIVDPTASGYEADWVIEGRGLYRSSCVSCHGADAKGLPNLGKNLVTSQLVATLDDEQLVAFLKKGRPSSDPENTTKVDMPPKGGNPALDDEKLESIAVYLRELQAVEKKSH